MTKPKERVKPITFYPDPVVKAWYEALPNHTGTETINRYLKLAIECVGQPITESLERKLDEANAKVAEIGDLSARARHLEYLSAALQSSISKLQPVVTSLKQASENKESVDPVIAEMLANLRSLSLPSSSE